MVDDIAVVTCHFNWANFDRPVQNALRFSRQCQAAGIPLFGVELHLESRPAEFRGVPGWRSIQCGERAVLWQKEALHNLALREIPAQFTKLAFLDSDLLFANLNWLDQTSAALEETPVVQPFAKAHWTDQRGGILRTKRAAAESGLCMRTWKGHPGFAWAMTREFFSRSGGFYDHAPMGAGDLVFAFAVLREEEGGRDWDRILKDIGPANKDRFHDWCAWVRATLDGAKPSYVEGDVFHEWHGSLESRRYGERSKWIADFTAERDLVRHPLGYWEWSDAASSAQRARMTEYFYQRREDTDE